MLVLSRKIKETILVGPDIRVTVTHLTATKVKIGIEAPKGTVVLREELRDGDGGCSIQSAVCHDGVAVGMESDQHCTADARSPCLKKAGKVCKKAKKAVPQP